MRPFNHAGPGQQDHYVVGTLARQVAEAEVAGLPEAWCAPATRTRRATSPTCATWCAPTRPPRAWIRARTTSCSGRAATVRELIELVRAAASIPVRHEIDPARVRAHDVPEVRGSADRLRAATGWDPEIPLEQTVADALEAWRRELS